MISVNEKDYVFQERFRPNTIEDIILPKDTKDMLRQWVNDKQIPHLLLASKTPGLGKSSLAHVLIKELDAEAQFINASMDSNIDTLRSRIQGFVSTVSFDNRPKIVVLDEADYLNPNSTQPALRGFIEEFSKSARFILTVNYADRLIEPLRDRLMDLDFDVMFRDNKGLIKDVYIRAQEILKVQNIKYEPEDLKYLVKHYYPSSRSIVKKLQQFSYSGTLIIDKEKLDIDTLVSKVLTLVINEDFEGMRKQITLIADPGVIYTDFYDNLDQFPLEKRPPIVLIIAKYQAHDALVRDRVVNAAAMCTEIMTTLRT